VFIPVLLMGGIVGRVFREFAVTIAVAILISGFVSLTLTPMLCARVLKGHHGDEKKQMLILRIVEVGFRGMLKLYEWTLDLVLRFKSVTLLVTLATLALTVYLYVIIPKGLFPSEDTGMLSGITTANTDISIPALIELQAKVYDIIRADKAVDYVSASGPAASIRPSTRGASRLR